LAGPRNSRWENGTFTLQQHRDLCVACGDFSEAASAGIAEVIGSFRSQFPIEAGRRCLSSGRRCRRADLRQNGRSVGAFAMWSLSREDLTSRRHCASVVPERTLSPIAVPGGRVDQRFSGNRGKEYVRRCGGLYSDLASARGTAEGSRRG